MFCQIYGFWNLRLVLLLSKLYLFTLQYPLPCFCLWSQKVCVTCHVVLLCVMFKFCRWVIQKARWCRRLYSWRSFSWMHYILTVWHLCVHRLINSLSIKKFSWFWLMNKSFTLNRQYFILASELYSFVQDFLLVSFKLVVYWFYYSLEPVLLKLRLFVITIWRWGRAIHLLNNSVWRP